MRRARPDRCPLNAAHGSSRRQHEEIRDLWLALVGHYDDVTLH